MQPGIIIHLLTLSSHKALREIPDVDFGGIWTGEIDMCKTQFRLSIPLLFFVLPCEFNQ